MSGLSRRELLKRGAVALAAGNVYSLLDGIAATPARAAAAPARLPEQYLLPGQQVVLELGIEVIVPPLHHRVVTARVKVKGAKLHAAQTRLEHTLAQLDKQYATSPSGLGVTVAWGLPYFGGSCRSSPTAAAIRRTCLPTCAARRRTPRASPQ
jgi:hypothetical protein